MQAPGGIAKKAYLLITIIIIVPMLIFTYLDAVKTKNLLLEKKLKPLLTMDCPIYQAENLISYTWGNNKLESINKGFYWALLKGTALTISIWLAVLLVIHWILTRLETAFQRLEEQILQEKSNYQDFTDFPQLKPILNMIINLREKLKKETTFLNWTLEKIPGAFILINSQQTIILANNGAYSVLALDKEKINLPGQQLNYLDSLLDYDPKKSLLLQALDKEKTFLRKKIFLNNKILQADAAPVIDPQSREILGAATYFYDITQQEKKNQALEEMTDCYLTESMNLQLLIDSVPLGIISIDKEAKITTINQTYQDYFLPLKSKSLIGQSFRLIADLANIPYKKTPIIQALQGKKMWELFSKLWGEKYQLALIL